MFAVNEKFRAYLSNYKTIAKLGAPILIGQLGIVVVGFADNIMVGRYSTEALASASFVNNVFNAVFFCCIGFTYGILPLVGELYGQRQYEKIGRLLRSALVLNSVYTILLVLAMTVLYFNLHHLGQPEELLPLIRPYYLLFLVGLLPVSIFNVLAQWSYGIKNTIVPMWVVLVTNVINIIGNYLLIYGHFGMPEMGLTGAGVSTLVARVICPVAMITWLVLTRDNKPYLRGILRGSISRDGFGAAVWRTSIPVSMQMTFESGSFSVAAIMAGWLGAISLAAYQIIVIVGMLGFCLYYAIGSAIAVIVSNEAGLGDEAAMRRAGWSGYHLMLAMATISTLVFVFFSQPLMHLFTDDYAVLTTALTLIFPLVLYQLGDATQVTFANALRGTSHVMPMLWIALLSYIFVGIPATYILAFTFGMGIYGIVLSFSVSLFLAGALFLIFFLRATRDRKLIVTN